MLSDPLVSILMPTYRRPHYLRQALASAVGQTYKNLQIIVRDNASGDQTAAVVRSFDDPRIEFLQALQTGSAWENGRECIRRAKGKYRITLCDDDVLEETYVETLTSFLEKDPGIMAAYGATYVIDEEGATTSKRVPLGTYTADASEIIRAWCGGTLPLATGINALCPAAFTLQLGDRHCFPGGHNSDNAVFMAAGIRGKVLFTDQCIFYYRVHSLNAERGHGCGLRAEADRAFLAFLDGEVRSPGNVGLPNAEWPSLRAALRKFLAHNYYQHLLRIRLGKDGLLELIWNATGRPVRIYGIRNMRMLLRENRFRLRTELERRILAGLRRFGTAFRRARTRE
jgi:glycosyltransferase involved in cell wall biosynthesis